MATGSRLNVIKLLREPLNPSDPKPEIRLALLPNGGIAIGVVTRDKEVERRGSSHRANREIERGSNWRSVGSGDGVADIRAISR